MKVFPFDDVLRKAEESRARGAVVHQQFNCHACGLKQTMDTPDTFYATGECEACGAITNIVEDGCNFLAHFRLPRR